MPLAAGTRLGPYEIQAAIGAGGMGQVWRAHDRRLEREVALKVLPADMLADETARARLVREARLASKLNHPHICTIYEVGETDGQTYIAMELVEGQPLSARLASGPLPIEQVLRYGQHLADALAHAHGRGVVHRDLKSANVVVTPEGQVKVLDFGLAKRLTAEDLTGATTVSEHSLTALGTVAGTLAYMAPEQLRGQAADARSDIWALGVVLYEMAGGTRPFEGQTGFELTSAILKEAPPPLPSVVPAPLRAVVERCLAKEPAERYQRGTEVRAALDAVQAGTLGARWRGARTLVRRRWLAGAAGLALLVLVVAVLAGLDVGGLRSRVTGADRAPAIKLAVLPFANLSGDADQEYVSDGLTAEMIGQLGRLHPATLRVSGRASVMPYKNSKAPISQIGRELGGVDYFLGGSVQREAKRVRITAELIKVSDQTQVWTETYEREAAGILILESDVAEKVGEALALTLLPAEKTRLANARPVNPEAYDAYLKGLQHFYNLVPAGIETALQYFELALKKDPNYAPAYAGISLVWAARKQLGWTASSEATPKAKAAALRAVALDDTVAVAHYALAIIMTWSDWDWAGAESEFKRAIELDPSFPDARAYYSHLLIIMGRPEEALVQGEKALELDPLNPLIRSLYANGPLLYARRYDDAIAQARKVLRTSPDHLAAHYALWYAYSNKGMYKEALSSAKVYLNGCYPNPDTAHVLDRGYAEGGYRVAMKRAADALAAHSRDAYVIPADIAGLYEQAGEKDLTFEWLERDFESHGPGMPYLGLYFDSLRSDPRFQALCRRIGLPQEPSPRPRR